ncbi:hypothetical protein PRZ48_014717 [Zasmidium cellare]|uniref:Histone H4 n=1 Tax=Zasmidium cellare TaxID=395010 RepID=A0ABR0DZ37_ZASCE|nr:hypothetical protein PRZ48_014717 [Zasmidium cellare]
MARNKSSNGQASVNATFTPTKKVTFQKKPTARKSVVGFGGPYRQQAEGNADGDDTSEDDNIELAQQALAQFRSRPAPLIGQSSQPARLGRAFQARRHRKILRDNIRGITAPDVRRLARRGGVKRMGSNVYDGTRTALKQFLETVIGDIVLIVDYANRKTVTTIDVVYALKKQGKTIYGFDD